MFETNEWRSLSGEESELFECYFKKSTSFIKVFFSIWSYSGIIMLIALAISQSREILGSMENEQGFPIFSFFSLAVGLIMIYFCMIKFPSWCKKNAANREINALKNGAVRICKVRASGKESKIRRLHREGHMTEYNYYIRVTYADIGGTGDIQSDILTTHEQYNRIQPGDEVFLICYDNSMRQEYMMVVSSGWFDQIRAMQNGEKVI